MLDLPTPHLDKLRAILANDKLPESDGERIHGTIERYDTWLSQLKAVEGADVESIANTMVTLLNDYKQFIDLDLIFDSENDFLYRQKGQTKLDNSVIEEFLPHLVAKCVFDGVNTDGVRVGPTTAFSAIYFASSLGAPSPGGGLHVRTKDQDFAIGKCVYLTASHKSDFSNSVSESFYIAYVVAECKTNLDKTMFQEACATAHDVKSAVTGSKYFLLSEWLDMTPQSTAPTDIDEVLILRKAKRIPSNHRKHYASYAGRSQNRESFGGFLKQHPFEPDIFLRFVNHIAGMMGSEQPGEDDVLSKGYF